MAIKQGVFLILLCFLLSNILFSGCTDVQKQQTSSGVDFAFTTIDGQTVHLRDYYGNIVVLDLMGVNCQPCMYQMFELKKISENFSQDNVTIISIDVWVSSGENAALLQEYFAAFKAQANVILDWTFGLDDSQGTIGGHYAPSGVPTLYILDTKGNIYYTHVGYEEYATLAQQLNALLGA